MNNLCVIPARLNSKRIRNKNIKLFNNKPIIHFAISKALETNLFKKVIVSTDSPKIAEVAERYGAEIPFMRPQNLADDFTDTKSVICHAIEECKKLNIQFDYVCCIYPCVPFLKSEDLLNSYKLVHNSNYKFVFPIAEHSSNIQRALLMNDHNNLSPLFPNNADKRTQDIQTTYYDAGQFYWGHKKTWSTKVNIHNEAKGYIIPQIRARDIDNENDWINAELFYNYYQKMNQ